MSKDGALMSDWFYHSLLAAAETWGLCSICDGEHAWANVKCDLLDTNYETTKEN